MDFREIFTYVEVNWICHGHLIFFHYFFFFSNLPSACVVSYFHARTRRLHLLKAIHYDSKIISFDSSRQRRGRHPIKSYVAAPETTIRIRRASLYISLVQASCVPVIYSCTCSSFSPSFIYLGFRRNILSSRSGERYLAEWPRLRRETEEEWKFFLFVLFKVIKIYEGDSRKKRQRFDRLIER